MKIQRRFSMATSHLAVALSLLAANANASESIDKKEQLQPQATGLAAPPATTPPLAPAPLGVFGADMPGAGKLIFSVIPQFIGRSTSLEGARAVSSQEIVAITPWYFDPRQKGRVPSDGVAGWEQAARDARFS